jgi:hypothetical protein
MVMIINYYISQITVYIMTNAIAWNSSKKFPKK